MLRLLRGLFTPLTDSPAFRSGLVRGLLLGLNTSLNFRTGDLLLILLILPRLLSGRRVSALSMRPGIGRLGVDSEIGPDVGEGEDSAVGGSTSADTLCEGKVLGGALVLSKASLFSPGTIEVLIRGDDAVKYP